MSTFRTQIYWSYRDEPESMALQRFAYLLQSLAGVHPSLSAWTRADVDQTPVQSADEIRSCLYDGQCRWDLAGRSVLSRRVDLRLRGSGALVGGLTLTDAMPAPPLPGIFLPNRVAITLDADPSTHEALPQILYGVLVVLVHAYLPDFGHVGAMNLPVPAKPLQSQGEPPIGWITYLRAGYPIPAAVSEPAVLYPVPGAGTLVITQRNLFDAADETHRAGVARVARELRAMTGSGEAAPPRASG